MPLGLARPRSKWLSRVFALNGVFKILTNHIYNFSMFCADLHTLHGLQPIVQHLSHQSAQLHEEVYGAN